MNRDLQKLRNGPFDVLVIGGGIYGSWIALHAASAGLKVAIVEQSDWGSATSSSSSKLLHGGLRYLENFEFGLVRKSLHERRELHRRLPHHVRPLRFLVPVYRHSRVGRLRLKAGLWLYDCLAGRDQPVGPHESFSADRLLQLEPSLSASDLTGGFSYGDCGTDDARLVLEVVESAIAAGAAACNYVKAVELITSGEQVIGARLRDEETAEAFDVRSSLVINAAGPWIFRLPELDQHLDQVRLTKGVHLVMPALPSQQAVLLTAKSDGRVFFLIPWYGRTLLGTTDTDFSNDPKSVAVEPQDVRYLLDSANDYLNTKWTTSDIHAAFVGLRTLQNEVGKSASGVSREWHLEETVPGLLTSIGGKLTSARVDAADAAKRILQLLKRRSTTAAPDPPLAWFPGEPFAAWSERIGRDGVTIGLDSETAANCARRYGARFSDLMILLKSDPSLAQRIVADLPFCRAEVIHAAKNEMARTLIDILRRRIPLSLLTRLESSTVSDVCRLAGDTLGWDSSRRAKECEMVLHHAAQWRAGIDLSAPDGQNV